MSPIQYVIIVMGSLSSVLALVVAVLVVWNTNSRRIELYQRKLEAFNLQKTKIEARLKEEDK